ncbi:M1 family aminopeptidase [Dyella mobilis]|uniref:M1 family metallopeptidase n=1 Tax=Dyella mobilis TaxID=1849582 RepID=A0ABS2KBB3_9GAMM|nr:M1 family aminopeptidase [Dyella mobilis]MBM7128239.1 M1 family metallopeptidase [Dyella mobilis]GLQ99799.1 peptidase [Dyella mobilis]
MKIIPTLCGAVLAALSVSASAADAQSSGYNPLETFAPYVYPQPANAYRSADGQPGPLFWQNRADYQIKAALDPATRKLTGDEVITYTNRSPNDLDVLWLQVEQNRYLKDARGAFDDGKFPTEFTDGEHIASVAVESADGTLQKADWVISDTRMQVRLPQSLKARDGKLRLHISYSYTVPGEFGGRTDVNPTKNGDIFEIAQWYPRMCVYDDLRGWNTDPYLNNEFYLEYGDYDYSVTVPWDMIVVGAGELLNPQDVLTKTEQQRLEQARHSDATVMIRSAAEVNDPSSRPKQSGTLTWHFRIQNSRDAVFGASKAYIWDAARINLPNGKTALAESAYPVESAGKEAWGRATEYVKASTEYFSKQWYPYPYPVAINEAGSAGGMEYPSITFDSKEAKGSDLHALIAHEIGHTWFPMIVGTDERRNAWMDEGFNTFIDVYEADHFNHGEYAPKRDPEYAPGGGNPADEIVKVLMDPNAPSLLTRADAIQEKYRHPVTYFKSAFGLVLLREQILGPERFDPAFRQYIQTWAYKHPSPSDFFRFMESETGEDLGWFWRGWYEHNWKLDLAVQNVAPVDGDWHKGAQVTVANLDKLVMPSTLEVVYTDGSKQDLRVPVETWMQHRSYVIRVDGNKPVKSATIDPQHAIPDVDRSNNTFTVK